MTAIVAVLVLVNVLLTVLVIGLLRSHADILRALHDLGVSEEQLRGGQPARRPAPAARFVDGVATPDATWALGQLHDIDGHLPDGGVARIGLDGAPGLTLLAFLSSGCSTCADFWRALATDEVSRAPGADTRVVIVTQGPESESVAAIREVAPSDITTVMSSSAWDAYGVAGSPYFVLVDGARGVIGEGSATTWDRVVDLLGKSLADSGHAADPAEGLSRRDLLMGRDRELRADRELAAAGIDPGSPSLYGHSVDEEPASG